MKKWLFLILFTSISCAQELPQQQIDNARLTLKNYALSSCFLDAYKEEYEQNDIIATDIALASSAFHFMGAGYYHIKQNEETFETEYDPYQVVKDYIITHYPKVPSEFKQGGESNFYRCLTIVDSKEFNDLIIEQDEYIAEQETISYPKVITQ